MIKANLITIETETIFLIAAKTIVHLLLFYKNGKRPGSGLRFHGFLSKNRQNDR
jgi:hypothetical protein